MPSEITHRIAAGGIVLREGKVLMVRHPSPDGAGFWIPPGGGMNPGEGAFACAEREVFEETGIRVRARRVAYVQEVVDAKHHQVKFWVVCDDLGGGVSRDHLGPTEADDLLEARFLSEYETRTGNVVPTVFQTTFWRDAAAGFPHVQYLGCDQAKY